MKEKDNEEMIEVSIISGVEGLAVLLNDYRIAGPKPWGGGRILRTWRMPISRLEDAGIPIKKSRKSQKK